MTPRRAIPAPLVLLLLAAAAAACSSGGTGGGVATATASGQPATLVAPTASATLAPAPAPAEYGIAAPVPPHAAAPTSADWQTLYAAVPALGGWLGAPFTYQPPAGIPDAAAQQLQTAQQHGFHALLSIGFDQGAGAGYRPSLDFRLPGAVGSYLQALVALAKATQPPYLGIGDDVNLLWAEDHEAYDGFVESVPSIVAAIHRVSPQTVVYATFQYEALRGGRTVAGDQRPSHWVLLEQVAPLLDLVAFTSDPALDYASPGDIPATYYADALDHVAGRPVAFASIGWPAAAGGGVTAGATPEQQAAFVQRLPALLHGVTPRFVMWPSAYDDASAAAPGAAMGLSTQDGTARPALSAWQQLATGR